MTSSRSILEAAKPPTDSSAPALSFDEVYAQAPKRDNEIYATFARTWNGAVASVRKTVADIFKR